MQRTLQHLRPEEVYLIATCLYEIIRADAEIDISYSILHKMLRDENLTSEHPKKSNGCEWLCFEHVFSNSMTLSKKKRLLGIYHRAHVWGVPWIWESMRTTLKVHLRDNSAYIFILRFSKTVTTKITCWNGNHCNKE